MKYITIDKKKFDDSWYEWVLGEFERELTGTELIDKVRELLDQATVDPTQEAKYNCQCHGGCNCGSSTSICIVGNCEECSEPKKPTLPGKLILTTKRDIGTIRVINEIIDYLEQSKKSEDR